MNTVWLEVVGVLVLVVLVGFFSASEVAVLASRRSRLKELADDGNARAATLLNFLRSPDLFLATVHVGSIFSLILASGLGGIVGVRHLAPALASSEVQWIREASAWISLVAVVGVLGIVTVVLGELVPKSLALRSAESIALRVAPTLAVCATLFRLPARALTFLSNLLLAPFRDSTTFAESRISEEEFKLMLEEGTKTGVIDKTEHELIRSIFEFTDTTAKEVMIPRPDIVALNIDAPREDLVRTVLEEGYSRMPVFRETLDTILGIVYTKDLLGLMEYRNVILLEDIIRPAFFIPETAKISALMRELQRRKIHLAIVVDEFGGTEGIVTMEDILEEIVGEIHDEYDEELRDVEQSPDGSLLINARMSVHELNERFGLEIPEADGYDSLGGFLHMLTGRIPEHHEQIAYRDLTFVILKKSQRRIRQVRVERRGASASPAALGTPSR